MSDSTTQELARTIRKLLDEFGDTASPTCCEVRTAATDEAGPRVTVICVCANCGAGS